MTHDKKAIILIVDDKAMNVQFIAKILKDNNYKVNLAANGNQALDSVKNEKPDLILLDVMMPGLNGYGVCQHLKNDEETKNIPIIFFTFKTESEDIIKGFDMGCVDYIKKPFNHLELLARIKVHVELKRAMEEIASLRGILPICAKCKKIRDDKGYWEQVEVYVERHSEAQFSHGLCPECAEILYGDQPWYKNMLEKENQKIMD